MDTVFLQELMEKTGFPQEARAELLRCARLMETSGFSQEMQEAVSLFYDVRFSMEKLEPLIQKLAQSSSISPYTIWMLFLMEAAKTARGDYRAKGISEEVFWDTFCDLKYKAVECWENHGVWGTFVAFWYPIFYSCDLVKLGRLEYENRVYARDEPYTGHGITLKKGDPVKSIHIPSSGEPFHKAARLESYRRAYDFFREELRGGPLVCICHSWLLYPENRGIFPQGSNTADFMNDFDILFGEPEDTFQDGWRVFGPEAGKPAGQLPERTSLQRAFKRYLQAGKKTGEGFGVLIFDGEKLLTGKNA